MPDPSAVASHSLVSPLDVALNSKPFKSLVDMLNLISILKEIYLDAWLLVLASESRYFCHD